MIYALAAYIAVAVCALLVSAALALSVWEHRRFLRQRAGKPLADGPWPKAVVFAPCRGLDWKLEDNLRPLFELRYPDYELVFVLESQRDPAYGLVRRLIDRYADVRTRICLAGAAVDTGQKVHNLIAATGKLPPDAEVLAFVDSDASPHPDWLSRLVDRVRKPEIGAATGYRWFVPEKAGPANLLLASINANVAGLMGPHWHNHIWGGSWAIRRELFEAIELRKHWQGTLSDDLVASRLVRQAGKKVAFEPHCLVESPVAMRPCEMLEFVRRQLVLGRFYARRLWLAAVAVSTLGVVAFWGGAILAAWWLAAGKAWAWVPLAGCGLLYALAALRGWLRQDGLLGYFAEHAHELRRAARFDIWAAPLVQLVAWCGLIASMIGRRIVWRGIRYRLGAGGSVQIEEVRSPADHEDRRVGIAHRRRSNRKSVGGAHPT